MLENSFQLKIAECLRDIGRKECLEKAELITNSQLMNSGLNLRSLGLNAEDAVQIAVILKDIRENENTSLTSISFSYNKAIKDSGAIDLIKSLPFSIRELGFVACGIGDKGGQGLLHWMRKAPNLSMMCDEQNSFSKELIFAFKKFSLEYPNIMVVV